MWDGFPGIKNWDVCGSRHWKWGLDVPFSQSVLFQTHKYLINSYLFYKYALGAAVTFPWCLFFLGKLPAHGFPQGLCCPPSSQHISGSPFSSWRTGSKAAQKSRMNTLPLQDMASPCLSLRFFMAQLFGMIPKPIHCLHVYFGSTLETPNSWQCLWKEPVKLKQVLLLLSSFLPSAESSFSFLPSPANMRRSRAGMELWKKAPLSWVHSEPGFVCGFQWTQLCNFPVWE